MMATFLVVSGPDRNPDRPGLPQIEVGDVWGGRVIVGIEPPAGSRFRVYFQGDGHTTEHETLNSQMEFLVTRPVQTVEGTYRIIEQEDLDRAILLHQFNQSFNRAKG